MSGKKINWIPAWLLNIKLYKHTAAVILIVSHHAAISCLPNLFNMIEIANKDIVNGIEKAISFNSNNLNNIIYLYENKLNKYNSLLKYN